MSAQTEWDAAALAGEKLARDALYRHGMRHAKQGKSAELLMATGFGALKESARFLRELTRPEGEGALERWAVAYVRGAVRDADGPLHEDGRPMLRDGDA